MNFRKLVRVVHLWLGLASGIIVLILGITGCLLAFETEIRNLVEDYQYVATENRPVLTPSELKKVSDKVFASGATVGVEYMGEGKAARAAYYDEERYELVYMNPYSGQVLKHKDMSNDFFRIVLAGHYNLWLPVEIGQPIVSSATLIFVIMMISGIILWWPKNKAGRKQRFSIKWNAKWRRVNYDLHNVLGFYMTWVAIFLALSGLVFGFEWFAQSVYWVASGGEHMEAHAHPLSDSTQKARHANMADYLWSKYKGEVKPNESYGVYFAHTQGDAIELVINHKPGTYYNSDYLHFDQYTGEELEAAGSYAGRFSQASLEDKIIRMNYDIHVGAILGLTGKVLAFFGSLIAASLPVTGFLIWRGRKKKGTQRKRTTIPKQPLQTSLS